MVCFEPVNAHIQYRGGGRDRERVNDSKHWDPLGVGNSICGRGVLRFASTVWHVSDPSATRPCAARGLPSCLSPNLKLCRTATKWQVWNSERPGGVTTWPRSFSETPHGRTGPTIAQYWRSSRVTQRNTRPFPRRSRAPRNGDRPLRHRHSSSASRFTAGAAGFLTLIQSADRPNRYGEPSRFDTMPSQPSLQA